MPVKQIYNDRRLYFGGAPGAGPADSFGPIGSTSSNVDKRGGRAKGKIVHMQRYILEFVDIIFDF